MNLLRTNGGWFGPSGLFNQVNYNGGLFFIKSGLRPDHLVIGMLDQNGGTKGRECYFKSQSTAIVNVAPVKSSFN